MNKKYKEIVLDNGIKLFIHSDKTMKKTFFSYSIKYGSSGEFYRFNYDGKDYNVLPGCAHFLEHLLLEHSPYGDLFILLKNYKLECNAYTTLDRTTFYFIGTKSIKSSIKKMITSFEKPTFNNNDVKHTSKAIVEETKRAFNDPFREGDTLAARNAFNSTDLIHESLGIIGNEETTKKIDSKLLKLCYDAFYVDDRKVLVLAGPIDEDEMINYINGIYKKIKPHINKTKVYVPNNKLSIRKKEDVLIRNNIGNSFIMFRYNNHIDDFSLYERCAFLEYISISCFSDKSDFFDRLKKEEILVSYDGYERIDAYNKSVFIYGFNFTVKDIDKFTKEYKKEINNLKFDKEDFELYKKGELAELIYSDESKYRFYTDLSGLYLYFDKVIDEAEEIRNLSFNRLIKFYKSLDLTNESFVIVTKDNKKMD
jgi:predicted Zn-dependent peptidase